MTASEMIRKRSIIYTLREREINVYENPINASLKILNELVQQKSSSFTEIWSLESKKPIILEDGFVISDNFTTFHRIYGHLGKPSLAFQLKRNSSSKKILEGISYTYPKRRYKRCGCEIRNCDCISKFFIYVTSNDWIGILDLESGPNLSQNSRKYYIKSSSEEFPFKFIRWNVYGKNFTVSSRTSSGLTSLNEKQDVVLCVALFSVFPLMFQALLEFKRSVFGSACKHVNVSDNLLIVGIGYDRVHLFSFTDLLSQSNCKTYAIGKEYKGLGRLGCFPTLLPINGKIDSAPPLLMNVQCHGQSLVFGGFPFSCIYAKHRNSQNFCVSPIVNTDTPPLTVETDREYEPDLVQFHPDASNRIFIQRGFSVECYRIKSSYDSKIHLDLDFAMGYAGPEDTSSKDPKMFLTSYGRSVPLKNFLNFERTVMAVDYDDELDLIGVLGFNPSDADCAGQVKLFNGKCGTLVKCIDLKKKVSDIKYYQLILDRTLIYLLEKTIKNKYKVFVYELVLWSS